MSARVWTREELDRVHPFSDERKREGWVWAMLGGGHWCARNRSDYVWVDARGVLVTKCTEFVPAGVFAPPADVALAVILASNGLDSREAMAAAMDSMASKAGRRSLLAGGWEDPEPGEEHVNEDSEAESLYAGMADGFVAAAKMLRRGTVQP